MYISIFACFFSLYLFGLWIFICKRMKCCNCFWIGVGYIFFSNFTIMSRTKQQGESHVSGDHLSNSDRAGTHVHPSSPSCKSNPIVCQVGKASWLQLCGKLEILWKGYNRWRGLAICNHCKRQLSAKPWNGTKHLHEYLNRCLNEI